MIIYIFCEKNLLADKEANRFFFMRKESIKIAQINAYSKLALSSSEHQN